MALGVCGDAIATRIGRHVRRPPAFKLSAGSGRIHTKGQVAGRQRRGLRGRVRIDRHECPDRCEPISAAAAASRRRFVSRYTPPAEVPGGDRRRENREARESRARFTPLYPDRLSASPPDTLRGVGEGAGPAAGSQKTCPARLIPEFALHDLASRSSPRDTEGSPLPPVGATASVGRSRRTGVPPTRFGVTSSSPMPPVPRPSRSCPPL